MSEDALYMLFDCLKENGVSAEVSELKGGKNGEIQKVLERSVELDFTEHDKVFEDKIADLENQIAYMKEKKNYLRTRCMEDATDAFDSGAYGRLTIVGRRVDLEAENKKLKQRIAELEDKIGDRDEINRCLREQIAELDSRETEKQKKRTGVIVARVIDGQEYVRLDDFMSVVNDFQAEIGT